MVHGHQLDRLGRQQARALELAAVAQHFSEAHVIHRGRDEPAAPREERRVAVGRVIRDRQNLELSLLGVPAMIGAEAGELRLGNLEEGVVHLEGIEDAFLQEAVEALPGDALDHRARDVYRDAVVPAVAGLVTQRYLRELCDELVEVLR